MFILVQIKLLDLFLVSFETWPWLPGEQVSVGDFFSEEAVDDAAEVSLRQDQVREVLTLLLVRLVQHKFRESDKKWENISKLKSPYHILW